MGELTQYEKAIALLDLILAKYMLSENSSGWLPVTEIQGLLNSLDKDVYAKISAETNRKCGIGGGLAYTKQGKCPINGRPDLMCYIRAGNQQVAAVTDGEGNAYRLYVEGYDAYASKCRPENKYDPDEYEFERFFSGFDF